jgi:myo-inositol 2-dehydrogenase/D-chiro-inositol 1-dehydrogenase
MKVGLIGAGWVVEDLHLPALAQLADVEVVAVADDDPERLARVASRVGAAAMQSPDALLEHPGLDAVGIWLAPGAQLDAARAAIDAGVHVFMEKPLTLDPDECDRLAAQAAAAGKQVMLSLPRRFMHLPQRARALVRSGAIGEVRSVRAVPAGGGRERLVFPDWDGRHALAGVLYEMGVHHFDLWRWVLGRDIAWVDAHTSDDGSTAALVAGLTDGVTVSAAFVDATAGVDGLDVFGDRARLELSCFSFDGLRLHPASGMAGDPATRLRHGWSTMRALPRGVRTQRSGGLFVDAYRCAWAELREAIDAGRPTACTIDDGRHAIDAVRAALRSAAQGGGRVVLR